MCTPPQAWERVAQHKADADMSLMLWKFVERFPSELSPEGGLLRDSLDDEEEETTIKAAHSSSSTEQGAAGQRKPTHKRSNSMTSWLSRQFQF